MRQFKITVNGKAYDVQVEENGVAGAPVAVTPVAAPAAAPAPVAAAPAPVAEPAPAAASAPGAGEEVVAPMPGTILKVLVSNGQAVKSGDAVVVLEAMKMENEITAPCDGTVTSVCVSQGESVDVGKVLVTIG